MRASRSSTSSCSEHASRYTPDDDLAFIGRHLSGQPGTVLDLGCGPGHITDYLRSLGVDATGIDMVPEFIAHAQAAHPSGSYFDLKK